MDWYLIAVILLILFAVVDLSVGITNDAVNFINSARASKAAPYRVILLIVGIGILTGVLFSGGMMEIARKGIFNPAMFTMPDLMTLFMAVVCADVILLDLFTCYGLPTSSTVSIIFDLLGASIAAATIKVIASGQGLSDMHQYINSSQALTIIIGIVLSIVIAFFCGALLQLFSRLIFTFNVAPRLARYGAIWGGLALASITRFILIRGAEGASFMTPEALDWLHANTWQILGGVFVFCTILLEILLCLKVNIFKPIILTGSFALALSFAANDLVNFIGVPLAGLSSYLIASSSSDPLTITMNALAEPAHIPSWYLLIAGSIMVTSLCFSKRAKTLSETEINLSRQDEGSEQYESSAAARAIVRTSSHILTSLSKIIPAPVMKLAEKRLDTNVVQENVASYDLLRASVNLMTASSLVSIATSLKLPLSTTFVSFMVAMGTSFADQAWGRESAVYRVSGVLTVISGWFLTAIFSALMAFSFVFVIHYLGFFGVLVLLGIVILSMRRTRIVHKEKVKIKEQDEIFNIKEVVDARQAIATTFQHTALFITEIRKSLNITLEALFCEDLSTLRVQRDKVKKIQKWSNIITANIFKSLRTLETDESVEWHKYTQTIRCLQSIAEGYGDIVLRSYAHINDHHKSLLPVQVEEVKKLLNTFNAILEDVSTMLSHEKVIRYDDVSNQHSLLRDAIDECYALQIERIKDRSSKTRLSILFYSIIGNLRRISRQDLRLLEIYQESLLGVVHKDKDGEAEPLELA